jgi:uncharacterized membrane protein YcaP (DUF421 family)
MWTVSLPHWWEFLVRAAIIYLFLLVLLRVTGKRQVGQLAPFDLVLLLVLSNAVQNAMNGGDNSITGGLLLASTLIALNWAVGWLTFRSKRLERMIEGRSMILVHDGCVDHEAMKRLKMTIHELDAALRAEGCAGPMAVRFAVMENNGRISVIPMRKEASPSGEP